MVSKDYSVGLCKFSAWAGKGMSDGSFRERRESLVQRLTDEGIIHSPEVARAMRVVPREWFLPKSVVEGAYVDVPLPIGYGQTISAPHMVAMMAEALELQVSHKVLEVGAGSGYNAAVLAEIVAPEGGGEGHVYTVEIVPELFEFARMNLESAGYGDRVTVILGDGSVGCPEYAPYDRIVVTAAAPKVPKALVDELKVGGTLVAPVGGAYFYQELMKVRREANGRVSEWSLGGVAFVPLRGREGCL